MSIPGERGTVLVLEDDPGIRRLQRAHLERAGYHVRLAANTREADEQLAAGGVDLLLLDYQLEDSENGLVFYRELHAAGRDVPAVLVTGFHDEERILEAMRAGVRDFIPKTPNFVDLVAPTVDRVMEQVRQDRRLHAAESASRAKDNFLATLSHELRTPLTPVAALVSALRTDDRLPEDVREDLDVIHRNIALEARLIDDLLDLTRISRGKLALRMEIADLRPVVEHALRTVCDAEEPGKTVRCENELTPGAHVIRGDPARLTQVFWNLLKNAVKFTPDGGSIRVRSRLEPRNGRDFVVVDVEDSGIGIDPETLPRIFGAFEQGDRGITRRFGGLGLGLAISKAIVETHGGTITAASEGRGKGSRFTVALPLSDHAASVPPAPDAATPKAKLEESEGAHILLVEDHPDTAAVLSRMLRRVGYRVTVGKSVREGLDAATAAVNPATQRSSISLVVSDLGLPDGSGIDLMKSLRSAHNLRGIALSGFGMDEDIRRAIDAGFSRHLTKPVDVPCLVEAIREMLEEETNLGEEPIR
jgi:signal transduction histidine kinase